ncbi:HET-domain-containing protein, partial [Stipitochalara longipes BDJ]
ISCELIKPELDSSLKYEALSYVWGQSTEQKQIMCNGTPFPVTGNLRAALRRLRRPDESRVLWIDQICIDQENIPERNQQVQIMRDIYRGAERVLIWLGEEEDDSDLAMDFIKTVVDAIWSLPPGTLLTDMNINDCGLPTPLDRRWYALGNLLGRPWFQRVWIVQECVMAKDAVLLCGGRELPWLSLEVLIVGRSYWPFVTHPILEYCVAHSISNDPPRRTALRQVHGITMAKNILIGSDRLYDIANILVAYGDCLATDPRDKLFAFLGCVPTETSAQYLSPDYGRSVKDVYMEIASISLLKFSNLKILSYAGRGQQQQKYYIPSWMPKWLEADSGGTTILQAKATDASKHYSPNFKLDLENGILTVLGKIVGKLDAVAEHLGNDKVPATTSSEGLQSKVIRILVDRHTKIKHCFEMASRCDPYPSGGTYISACKQTLVAGATPSGHRATASEVDKNFEGYYRVMSLLAAGTRPQLSDQTEEQRRLTKAAMLDFEYAFEEACCGRAFAVTEENYVGLAPVKAKAGDHVCIILGCDVPFIVREDDGKYVLVGECYIHGIMDGEAMDLEKYKIQDIILK